MAYSSGRLRQSDMHELSNAFGLLDHPQQDRPGARFTVYFEDEPGRRFSGWSGGWWRTKLLELLRKITTERSEQAPQGERSISPVARAGQLQQHMTAVPSDGGLDICPRPVREI
jgi:hypothetical protein